MMTQGTITISCQKCGGVARVVEGQDYYRCEYCSSLIQRLAVSVDRIQPTGAALNCSCPTCSQSLHTGQIEECRVLYCGGCLGILLRHADFGRIVQTRQAKRIGGEPAEPRPIDPGAYHRRVNCPSCDKTMEVHPYYGPGNIVVDSCVDCGFIWLDHGELTRVEQASSGRSTSTYTTCGTTSPLSERAMNAPPVNYGESKDESPLCALADLIFFGGR